MGFRHQKGVSPHKAPQTAKGKALGIKKELLETIEAPMGKDIVAIDVLEPEAEKPKKKTAAKTTKAKEKTPAKPKKKKTPTTKKRKKTG